MDRLLHLHHRDPAMALFCRAYLRARRFAFAGLDHPVRRLADAKHYSLERGHDPKEVRGHILLPHIFRRGSFYDDRVVLG